MNESAARYVLLVRSVETSGPDQPHWSEDDAEWASRAAAEIVGADADAERFLARRAQLAVERLGDRERQYRRLAGGQNWRPWSAAVMVAGGFALGLLMDSTGPSRHVNVLAFPLLGLLLWNLLTYAALLGHTLSAPFRSTRRRPGLLARMAGRLGGALPDMPAAADAAPALRFRSEWAKASLPLTGWRVARILHLSAAALAFGAITALYVRGLVLDFQAGWESTFLDATQVHQVLNTLLSPASAISGITVPDASQLEAMRLPAHSGQGAAPWIHLYAATLTIFVVLPRMLLALLSGLAARRLERRFPLPLGDAYFERLSRRFSGRAARLHLVPYSLTLSAQDALALQESATRAFGPRTQLSIAATVAFGDEDALPPGTVPTQPPPLTMALLMFSLSATPEEENHGRFLDAVIAAIPTAPLAALLDESAFRARFGPERLEERRKAWFRFLGSRGLPALSINLENTSREQLAGELTALLDRCAHDRNMP